MTEFEPDEAVLLQLSLGAFNNHVESTVGRRVRQWLNLKPQRLEEFFDDLSAIREELLPGQERLSVPEPHLPLLKAALLFQLKAMSQSCEERSRLTSDSDTKAQIEAELAPYQLLLNSAWFLETTAAPTPVLRDYLVTSETPGQPDLPERELDEKFGVLTAPALFLRDLAYYRFECCELRKRPVSVRNLSTTMGHSTGLIREQCPVW